MQILVLLEQTLTAEAVLQCANFLDMSQQRVKFPDIWVVYLPFQKQTLNSHPIIFNIHFMFNFRDHNFTTINNKLKIAAFSNPVSVNRVQEESSVLILTNKQSVYGVILDELMHYYKFLPLELDFTFLKSMRKVHNKGEELAGQEELQRAAEILIQAKNKVVKEQISIYKLQCQEYLRKYPNTFKIISSKGENRLKEKSIKSRKISSRQQCKKVLPQQKFIERIRSQGKQQSINNSSQKRSSFLLHPNLIRFQSSDSTIKKAQFSKEGLGWRLPRIVENSRMLQDSICSSIQKNKHIRVFFSPINRSSNTERAVLLRNILFSSKHSNVSGKSFQKQIQKDESVLSRDRKAGHEVSLQLELPNREEGPKKNRKLMLQLLRQKSKQALLSD